MQLREPKVKREERLDPPPDERVLRMLELAETKDLRFFFNLCRELTLAPGSTRYGFQRFLTKTPGWEASDPETRRRIVEAAKRLLTAPSDDSETCRDVPLNSILVGYMEAVWLLLEEDRNWLEGMPSAWWERWCWYFLREVRPNSSDEPNEEKGVFFGLVHNGAPGCVRDTIADLSKASDPESLSLLTGLFGLCEAVPDQELDRRLANLVREARVGVDRAWHVTRFLLCRNNDLAVSSCRVCLEGVQEGTGADVAIQVAAALLHEETSETWQLAISFLLDHGELARRVLGKYAHMEPGGGRRSLLAGPGVTPGQVAELFGVLLEHYPPESDIKHHGAYWVTDDDSAVLLRSRLVNWLSGQKTVEALDALKYLEQRFGAKYSWLRRPRSAVERAYRQSHWSPIPPETVASLLLNGSSRLIGSSADAVEGVLAAIEGFESSLRHESPSPLEDLWNTPRGGSPSPKHEERISDKLCEAIRRYFSEHAVTAEREVQVFRRTVSRQIGGAPGSEVDVLVRVPAQGMTVGDPIALPIEVKRSDNEEARTGLREQLANRYMSQLGTSHGVFVVVWLNAPNLSASHRPVWASLEEARESLRQQVEAIAVESNGAISVSAVVVDASLV